MLLGGGGSTLRQRWCGGDDDNSGDGDVVKGILATAGHEWNLSNQCQGVDMKEQQ